MSAIDIVILGTLYEEPMSAYDLQKALTFRKIDKWVKISTPSIYKKVLSLEKEGLLISHESLTKNIYTITDEGKSYYFEEINRLLQQEINIFLDFNSIISNFGTIPANEQKSILLKIREELEKHHNLLEEQTNIKMKLEIPRHGVQLLKQQSMLFNTLIEWVEQYLEEQREEKEFFP